MGRRAFASTQLDDAERTIATSMLPNPSGKVCSQGIPAYQCFLQGGKGVSVCSLKLEAKMKDNGNPETASCVSGNEDTHEANATYVVGYRKPPVHTRFQRNQSGNKKGRPKDRLSKKTVELTLEKVLLRKIALKSREGRPPEEVSALEALMIDSLHRGLKGDAREKKNLFDLILKFALDDASEAPVESAAEDEAILRRHKLDSQSRPDAAVSDAEGNDGRCEEREDDGGSSC